MTEYQGLGEQLLTWPSVPAEGGPAPQGWSRVNVRSSQSKGSLCSPCTRACDPGKRGGLRANLWANFTSNNCNPVSTEAASNSPRQVRTSCFPFTSPPLFSAPSWGQKEILAGMRWEERGNLLPHSNGKATAGPSWREERFPLNQVWSFDYYLSLDTLAWFQTVLSTYRNERVLCYPKWTRKVMKVSRRQDDSHQIQFKGAKGNKIKLHRDYIPWKQIYCNSIYWLY